MKFNFHGNYTQEDKTAFGLVQTEDAIKICQYLETPPQVTDKFIFEIFDTREGKQSADPNHSISRASARFAEMTVYRYWTYNDDSHFPHETTHLAAHTWARPYILKTELDTWDNKKIQKEIEMVSTSFMQEGLAIAVDDIVFNRKLLEEGENKFVDDWCREQVDRMPNSLLPVINLDGFSSLPNKVVVPFSASFSKFLLQKFGLEKYKKMYVSIKEIYSSRENVEIIESIYNQPDLELITSWRRSLTNST